MNLIKKIYKKKQNPFCILDNLNLCALGAVHIVGVTKWVDMLFTRPIFQKDLYNTQISFFKEFSLLD